MRICVAQTRPVRGDIPANIAGHKRLIEPAVAERADLIVFPELSLTGYEPTLAKDLALNLADVRLKEFQVMADSKSITIGVGVPMKSKSGTLISTVLFQPHKERVVYCKSHLHPDEEPFFVPGQSAPVLVIQHTRIAFAICYEISVPEHLESVQKCRPDVYVASVAKFESGIGKACERLSSIARDHSMPVLMANCVGFSDGARCAGRTSIWSRDGLLKGQLNDSEEGVLIHDTKTGNSTERIITA